VTWFEGDSRIYQETFWAEVEMQEDSGKL